MAIKTYRPTTSTRRLWSTASFEELTTTRPYKPLTYAKRKTGGRNSHGHVTCRHKGGGNKQRVRIIDFLRNKHNVEATVLTIEYDPIRTARISLIQYADGAKSYILTPHGLKVGDKVMSGDKSEIKLGNHLPLGLIPPGTPIHNIELRPGQGGKMVRSAGTMAEISAKEEPFALIKMPSGEIRKLRLDCYATVGQISNIDHENIKIGKAGRSRWFGIRPTVRGVAMNPVDHPLGGGEGKTSGGRHPVSPWGQPTKGYKTRKRNKSTNQYIVKDRRK